MIGVIAAGAQQDAIVLAVAVCAICSEKMESPAGADRVKRSTLDYHIDLFGTLGRIDSEYRQRTEGTTE